MQTENPKHGISKRNFRVVELYSASLVSGQFLTELERHAEAAAQYVRAVELAPAQYDLVLSAATALRHAGHAQRAENFYRRAAELKPQVTAILMQSAT